MKKILTFFLLMAIAASAKSQAILEHTYTDQTICGPYKMTSGEWIYAGIHHGIPQNEIYLYNENHVLIKTIQIQAPSGYSLFTLLNVSDQLFNSDLKIEVLYSIYSTNPSEFRMILKNENGQTLQEFPGQYYGRIQDMDGEFKMITATQYTDSNAYIYSLPGTMVDIVDPGQILPGSSAFPNPCSDQITLSYPLDAVSVTIRNATGEAIYVLPAKFGSQTIDISKFPAATYLYDVILRGGRTITGKFSVVH